MAIDWSHIQRQFKGLWVALADDETTVVASGNTASEAMEQARIQGHEMPILAHMPPELMTYVSA